jgi:hypothetical protein
MYSVQSMMAFADKMMEVCKAAGEVALSDEKDDEEGYNRSLRKCIVEVYTSYINGISTAEG